MFWNIKYKDALNLNIFVINIQNIVIILLIKVKKVFFQNQKHVKIKYFSGYLKLII